MDKNAYFELGLRLAIQQAGFEKDAGVISAIKGILKKKPPKKGSIEAWRKTDKAKKLMSQGSATETSAYNKFRQGGTLAKKKRTA